MRQSVTYKHKTIWVDRKELVRKKVCTNCGRKGLTHIHHWCYDFPIKEVRENPDLVLRNTSELCFLCHKKADTLKKYYEISVRDLFWLNDLMQKAMAKGANNV